MQTTSRNNSIRVLVESDHDAVPGKHSPVAQRDCLGSFLGRWKGCHGVARGFIFIHYLAVFDDSSGGFVEMALERLNVDIRVQIVDNHAAATRGSHCECGRSRGVGIASSYYSSLMVVRDCVDEHGSIHCRCAVHVLRRL
jgi:hypothetical protein